MPMPFNQGAEMVRNVEGPIDLGDNFDQVLSAQNARVKLQRFQKAWDVGSQLTAYYPFRLVEKKDEPGRVYWTPCMSVVYGHQVDYNLFKRGFLRSRCTMDAEFNVVGEGDIAYQFSRIANLLVNAKKEHELADCAAKDWTMMGQAAYQSARQAIEDKYDRTKLKSEKPIIGRFDIQRNTVCYVVAMDPATSAPKFQTSDSDKTKTGFFTHTLSKGKMQKLYELANNVLHGINAQNPGTEFKVGDVAFLEVLYNFTSARMERTDAGKAEPQGLAQSITLATRFPAEKENIQKQLAQLPTSASEIRQKLYAMEPMSDEELTRILQQYTFQTAGDWGYLSPEDKERMVRSANIIDYLRVVPADEELNKALTNALGHPIGKAPIGAAPTIDELGVSDTEFDISKQDPAVAAALAADAEGKDIPFKGDADDGDDGDLPFTVGEYAGALEV